MRFLLLHSSSDLYGASRIFLQTVTLLQKQGHHCVVVLSNKGPLEQALELVGAEVHIINLGILRRQYFSIAGLLNRVQKWRSATKALNALIRKHHIELVYSNTAAVLIGAWVARKNNLKHVWHIHEIIEQPKLLHQFLGWQMRKGADKLIVVSDAVAKCWKSALSDKTSLIRIYNGIEPIIQPLTIDYRKQFNVPDDAIVLGLAGRIHVIKGQPYFLEIAKALKQSNNFSKLHFFIAGDPYPGQEYLLNQMFDLIRDYQLEASVHYLGQVVEMSNFYTATDLLVVSSIQPDSFPTVILEAMQYGLPVAATAQGGALEMVQENGTGIFIPLDNAAVAAEKINAILPASIRQPMGAAGKERVAAYFSQAAFEKNISTVFENIYP
ncbi:MAG: glycosyltransferase family 4 protein [Chitinophagia bacterium]